MTLSYSVRFLFVRLTFFILSSFASFFLFLFFFFFNDTATTEIYTLSLHDALPIYAAHRPAPAPHHLVRDRHLVEDRRRSEEHTSELQSQFHLVCRLLLEKKKKINNNSSRSEYLTR